MTSRTRRNYTLEFKREAVNLAEDSDKTITEVSRDLGINSNLIRRWKKELANSTAESTQIDDKDAEIRRLRAELRDLKEDHEIIKKAAAYFAKNSR